VLPMTVTHSIESGRYCQHPCNLSSVNGFFTVPRQYIFGRQDAAAAAAAVFYVAKSRQDPGLAGLASHGGSGLIKGSSPNSTLGQCKNRTNHDHKVERT